MKKLIFYVLFSMTAVCGNGQELWYQNGSHIFNSNAGGVGIGTFSPRGKFDVDGPGDIYLADDLNSGTSQSLYLPGHIYLAPYNGTNVSYIQARRYNNAGTTALALRTYNAGSLTETMYLAGNGDVGIGTTSPQARLQISNGDVLLQNQSAGYPRLWLKDVSGNNSIKIDYNSLVGAGGNMLIRTSSQYSILLNDVGGNVGIGTATPYSESRLHVKALSASLWGIVAEASSNQKVMTMSHTGTAGYISTASVGTDGSSPMHFQTSGAVRMSILENGNIGIGTTPSADARLHIKTPASIPWGIIAEANANQKVIGLSHNGTAGFISTGSVGSDGASPIHFQTSGAVRMSILETGNVSIGTPLASNPNNYLLAVNGKIGAKEVRVEKTSAAWPDYVFEPGYKLPDLKTVETYIHKNGHLEDVPTASDVETNGIDVGEMNAILLKKVEELTLYVIELKKENERQGELIDRLLQKR